MLQKIESIVQQKLERLNEDWGEYEDEWTFHIEEDNCVIEVCFDDNNVEYFQTFTVPVNQINLDDLRAIAEEE